MSEDKERDDYDHDRQHLLHHIFVLLDYLERQSDNRLQAQFDDTRQKLSLTSPKAAVPPCDKYEDFFARLALLRKKLDVSRTAEDEQFLRTSRDFLAAVAHPATVETICITREYINTRNSSRIRAWRMWRPSGSSQRRSNSTVVEDDGFKDSARSLARTVGKAEWFAMAATAVALFFSAHAMVGRLIIDQEKDALTKYQELTRSADANRIGLLRLSGAAALIDPKFGDNGCPAKYQDIGKVEVNTDDPMLIPINGEQTPAGPTHNSGAADASFAAQEAAWNLITECRHVQWALMQLMTENVRLKSWSSFYINPWLGSFGPGFLVGWSDATIAAVTKSMNPNFCADVARAYNEDPGAGCKKIIPLLIKDSASVANSVLLWLTLYILPCLYAFVGAAAAAIIGLRRKLNASLLSYSDRSWVKQAMLLGFVFGGIIGLFTGYLSKSPETDGLGLSALALLAGYNVPAVSELLEDLSKRIFRPGERTVQPAKAA